MGVETSLEVQKPVEAVMAEKPEIPEKPKRQMCVNHPEVPAAGVCSRCNKPFCSGELTYHKGSLLCVSCLKRGKTMSLVTSIASVAVVLGFFTAVYVYLMPTIIAFVQSFFR
jgi:hypothetical protein